LGQPIGRSLGSGIGQRLISALVFWKKQVRKLDADANAQKTKKPSE
jgi:hypothetical protein